MKLLAFVGATSLCICFAALVTAGMRSNGAPEFLVGVTTGVSSTALLFVLLSVIFDQPEEPDATKEETA